MGIKHFFYISTTVFLISCTGNSLDVDVNDVEISLRTERLERDLENEKLPLNEQQCVGLRKKYKSFFDIYCERIIHLQSQNDSSKAVELSRFLNDPDVKEIAYVTDSVFKDIDEIKNGIHSFFQHYKYYFPKKTIPGNLYTFFSAFNYNIITTDDAMGIGLDMYLGEDCRFYPSLNLPQYMIRKFRKEYIINDCIKGFFQTEYDADSVKKEFLSQIIYQGKQLYFMEAMAPYLPDTIKTGYTVKQLKWCKENESTMWAFFIENKLLFSTSEQLYIKYLNDGNSTNGFPKDSPAKTGCFIGWQIVKQYMKKNADVTLEKLLSEKDAQKILNDSGYKPGK